MAMSVLGNGLAESGNHEDALTVRETELSTMRRTGAPEESMLIVQGNLANSYAALGRFEQSLNITRDIYARSSALHGKDNAYTLVTAGNLVASLVDDLEQFDEAKAFLRDRIPEAIRTLGKDSDITFRLQRMYAQCHYENDDASREDVTTAIAQLEDLDRRGTRIYGASHPQTRATRCHLKRARAKL